MQNALRMLCLPQANEPSTGAFDFDEQANPAFCDIHS